MANITLTINTNLAYIAGDYVQLSNNANNYIVGKVVSYNPSTGSITISPTLSVGSGTYGTWGINLSGSNGTAGTNGTSGGASSAGTSGTSGSAGTTGSAGLAGSSGTNAVSGSSGNSDTSSTTVRQTRIVVLRSESKNDCDQWLHALAR